MGDYQFSIIVPVYNDEKYLFKLFDSIDKQVYKNFEVIFIDDGSTDNSKGLILNYLKSNPNFHYYFKDNGGLSDARNYGLNKASGAYIIFLDADDFLLEDALIMLSSNLKENTDIIASNIDNYKNYVFEISQKYTFIEKSLSGRDFLYNQLKNNTMYMSACRNVYNRHFLLSEKLFFIKGIYHEDEEWSSRVFLNAKKVKVTNESFYGRLLTDNSITRRKDYSKNINDIINIAFNKFSENNQYDKKIKKELNDYYVRLVLSIISKDSYHVKQYLTKKQVLKLLTNSSRLKTKLKSSILFLNYKLYFFVRKVMK